MSGECLVHRYQCNFHFTLHEKNVLKNQVATITLSYSQNHLPVHLFYSTGMHSCINIAFIYFILLWSINIYWNLFFSTLLHRQRVISINHQNEVTETVLTFHERQFCSSHFEVSPNFLIKSLKKVFINENQQKYLNIF